MYPFHQRFLFFNIIPIFLTCIIIQRQIERCESRTAWCKLCAVNRDVYWGSLIARWHSLTRLPRLVNWGRLIRARDLKEGMRRGLSDCSSRIWGCVWWFCNWTRLRHRTTPTPHRPPSNVKLTSCSHLHATVPGSTVLSSSVSCSGLTSLFACKSSHDYYGLSYRLFQLACMRRRGIIRNNRVLTDEHIQEKPPPQIIPTSVRECII